MIKSMTAFAKVSHTEQYITAEITIRSYNSRHLDFSIHLPEACQLFEEDIKKIVGCHHQRGRIEIRVAVLDESSDPELFEVDEVKAKSYYLALNKIRQSLGINCEVSMDQILSARNIILPATKKIDTDLVWNVVSNCVETASKELDQMRRREGENLARDLNSRMDYIEASLAIIETEAKEIPLIYKKRLMERLAKLTADADSIDPLRLAQEAAILADKSDVSEEIARLYSHISQFREVMDADDSQGRKLNFLIQEFNREFNTIGSKAGNAVLSHMVVDLKSELEKIREQVQNIE